MLELSEADAAGIPVTADGNRSQIMVDGRRARHDRGHPAMHGVEAM